MSKKYATLLILVTLSVLKGGSVKQGVLYRIRRGVSPETRGVNHMDLRGVNPIDLRGIVSCIFDFIVLLLIK